MAQAKVSDFFGTKKRSHDAHPSKRRKIESADLDVKDSVISGTSVTSKKTPRTRLKAPTTRARGPARKKHSSTGQATIRDAFAKVSGSSSDTDGQDNLQDVGSSEVTEEITSCWDEHDGQKTPKRKTRASDSIEAPVSDCRVNKSARRRKQADRHSDSVTPKKDPVGEEEKAARGKSLAQSFRKSFTGPTESTDLCEKASDDVVSVLPPPSPSSSSRPDQRPGSNDDKPLDAREQISMPSDEDLAQVFKLQHPKPVSPLPPTPKGVSCKSTKVVTLSPRVKSSMDKMKELQKEDVGDEKSDKIDDEVDVQAARKTNSKKVITAKEMRERLTKCGKLDTLKAKLAEMNSSLKAVQSREAKKKTQTHVDEADATKTSAKVETTASTAHTEVKPVPAYERYEHLAREGPPSLALPGKYQRLLTTFQGTDTVVSMLFNRQETITFSKLQTAVQSMTRKNFEQKALGQMKTVYPDAYTFRQEKGLPSFGNKVLGYQLTVEPNLEGLGKEDQSVDKNEKRTMTAQILLKRKRIFHNSLVDITKDHHARFLSRQTPAIKIPSSMLTRWHPKFSLDSVPDIETAELPTPPLQKTQTAKQVLDSAKGKLPLRVEAAMAKVAMKSESSQPETSSTSKEPSKTPAKPNTSKPTDPAYKGIPLSLLEKIRAKEAARTQAALTRDPKEDKKTEMIGRLPTLIRSLRTFYVTEKKPSLLYKAVVDKLVDSYDTFISKAEVEAHLSLLQELEPKWMQIIEITRGKYVKIDKNMDISIIITKLNNLAKSRR